MENVMHRLSLDLTKPDAWPRVEVQRDNARTLVISLTQNGRPYWIADGVTAVFSARKPDGNKLFNGCTVEKNAVRYDFTDQTTNVAGITECEILLYSGDERILASPRFELAVDDLIHQDGDIPESATEVTALTQMVAAGTAMIEDLREALAGLDGVEEILTEARAAAQEAEASKTAANGAAAAAQTASGMASEAANRAEDAQGRAESWATSAQKAAAEAGLKQAAAQTACSTALLAADRAEAAAQEAREAADGIGGAELPADLFGGYERFYRSIALGRVNPEAPLDIATYDGSGQLTHPCVRHFPGGFGGHEWWMVATPYPYSALDLENPCVWWSDDGIHWSGEGIPNPLALPPQEGGAVVGYNSDPHLLLREDGVMEVWWRTLYESGSNAGYEVIYRRTSADGLAWSEAEELHRAQSTDGTAQELLCPVALYEDGIYRIWTVYRQECIRYYESADGRNWQRVRDIDVSNPDYPEYKVWHFDVNHTGAGYEFVGSYNIPGDYTSHKYICCAVSQDNITYSERVMILTLGEAGSFDERLLYRPTIVRLPDRVRVYYGANAEGNVWSIGMIEAPSAYLFNAVLVSGERLRALEGTADGLSIVGSFEESPWIAGYWDVSNGGALTVYNNMHRTQLVPLSNYADGGELLAVTATSSVQSWPLVRFNYFDARMRWIGFDVGETLDPAAGTQAPTVMRWPEGAVYAALSANAADRNAITVTVEGGDSEITEEQIQEIAGIAAGMVEVPGGCCKKITLYTGAFEIPVDSPVVSITESLPEGSSGYRRYEVLLSVGTNALYATNPEKLNVQLTLTGFDLRYYRIFENLDGYSAYAWAYIDLDMKRLFHSVILDAVHVLGHQAHSATLFL